MRQVVLLVLVAACKKAGDDYPVLPPDMTIDPTLVDAATHDGGGGDAAAIDALVGIAGRVCLYTDARAQQVCKPTGAGGLTVNVGGKTATTAADGSFTIGTPTGTNPVWHVSGAMITTSVMPFGSSNQIPAILASDYLDLEGQNGASVQALSDGEAFVRVVHAGAPLANAKGGSAPQSTYGPLYDTGNALVWNSGANQGTGAAGMVWFPGIAAGTATLSVTPPGGSPIPIPNVPIEGQSITYLLVDTP